MSGNPRTISSHFARLCSPQKYMIEIFGEIWGSHEGGDIVILRHDAVSPNVVV
jgi:hypothetical protein